MDNSLEQNQSAGPIPSLIDDLGSADGAVRRDARNKLVGIGLPAVPALITALSECNDHARWESAKALSKILDPSAVPALVKTLGDKNVDVRWAAAESLINFKLNAVAPILIMLVNDFDAVWLREGARYVLRQLKTHRSLDDATAKVLAALDGPAPEVEAAGMAKLALERMHIDWGKEIKIQPGENPREIDIPMGAEVKCSDGQCGKILHVILHPDANKVIQLVVKESKSTRAEYLVPIDKIIASSPTSINLGCSTSELEGMKLFKRKQIPAEELAIRRIVRVVATDGEVGKLDELLIEPDEGKITHLILREGHSWDLVDVTIQAADIDHIDEDAVYLKIDKCAIGFLPSIPRHRRKQKRN
jgi:sporulation protein YlmC with PRC-barrel domain